jgi:UDP-2,4-diacetamido-2,4,6-trideoxy-beta-L-altropyranose hydrolase
VVPHGKGVTPGSLQRPRVAFRVDSAAAIGSGHLRRCLTLAEMMRGWGRDVLFLCRAGPDTLNADVTAAGHRLIELPHALSPAEDAEASAAALTGEAGLEALVVDHYGLDAAWERALRPFADRIAVIDDLADRPHICDLLVDVTPSVDPAARYHGLLPAHCVTLFGGAYPMLRPEFRRLREQAGARDGELHRILVSFGAVDADDRCGTSIDAVRAALGTVPRIDVVVSRNAPHRASLAARAARDEGLTVHVDTPHMAELMRDADLAVGAGGATSWERACLGLPTLVAAIADNQRPSLAALEAAGCALAIDADRLGPEIEAALARLATSPGLLLRMSEAGRALVDGRGAQRVARAICPPRLSLRAAAEADSRDLWSWRNDPRVREYSKNSDPIPWEAHQGWLSARLADPDCALLIGEEAGVPVGVLRFDLDGPDAVISVYLTPHGHGRGIGPLLLRAGEHWLRAHRAEVRRILAEILPHNRASVAAFEAADYEARELRYERELSDE